jgi:hypothetical protein
MTDKLNLYIAAIKREIMQDTVLSECKTFSDLHNYCDANTLGFESIPNFKDDEKMMDFANEGMNAIDAWLKDRAK